MAAPVLSANSPVAGSITWTAFRLAYRGLSYAIPAGSTSSKYTWWPYNGGAGGALQYSNTLPVLTTDDALLFLNKNGVPASVPSTQAIDGSLIVSGSILADAIGANQVTADKIFAGAITTDKLAANAITADKIAAGAITASSLAANAITGKTITGGTITGTTLQTGATGQRIKLDATSGEVIFYTGDSAERSAGYLYQDVVGSGATRYGRLTLAPPTLANPANAYAVNYNPGIILNSPNAGNTADSQMYLQADSIYAYASVGTSAGGAFYALTDNHRISIVDHVGIQLLGAFQSGTAMICERLGFTGVASGGASYGMTLPYTMYRAPTVLVSPNIGGGGTTEVNTTAATTTSFTQYLSNAHVTGGSTGYFNIFVAANQ